MLSQSLWVAWLLLTIETYSSPVYWILKYRESVWIKLLSTALVKCLLWASYCEQAGDKLPAGCAFFPTRTAFVLFSARPVPRGGAWRSAGFVSEDWWIPPPQSFLYQPPVHLWSARQGKDNAPETGNSRYTVLVRQNNGAHSKTTQGKGEEVRRKVLDGLIGTTAHFSTHCNSPSNHTAYQEAGPHFRRKPEICLQVWSWGPKWGWFLLMGPLSDSAPLLTLPTSTEVNCSGHKLQKRRAGLTTLN